MKPLVLVLAPYSQLNLLGPENERFTFWGLMEPNWTTERLDPVDSLWAETIYQRQFI